MSLWATKRKLFYLGTSILVLLFFVGIPIFFKFYSLATCFDNKQNQNEKGIDCGGICSKLCLNDYAPLVYNWQRFVSVAPGVYNLLSYLENPNLSVSSAPIEYSFKLYDSEGIFIIERKGYTTIPAGKKFAIFAPSVSTIERKASRVTFEFTSLPVWQATKSDLIFDVTKLNTFLDSGTQRVEATLVSRSSEVFKKVEAIAIVYGTDGNAINFSKTVIDKFIPNISEDIVFTWPTIFTAPVSKVEILVRPI